MKIKQIVHSLKFRMMMITFISIAIAVGIFVGSYTLGNFLVWKYYLDDKMVEERSREYIAEFQQYVVDNKLFTTDMHRITTWADSRYMELVIYKDSELIYSPEWFEQATEEPTQEGELSTETSTEQSTELGSETGSEQPTEQVTAVPDYNYGEGRDFRDYLNEDARQEYEQTLADILEGNRELSPVVFKDGTLLVTVVDYSENLVRSAVVILSFILAFIVMAVIMLTAFSRLTVRITKLASNVKRVEQGAVDIPIYAKGKDEISTLAYDINRMRISIVSNMSKEREAWEANAGLITAMSHDIRTPLTVMMGYLDILELQTEDETTREYLSACRENAVKLKKLSDDMFQYFLVFGKREIELDFSDYPAADILHHMIDEHTVLLTEKGIEVNKTAQQLCGEIRVDLLYLGRVIDNVFSNINKYADVSQPVSFNLFEQDGCAVVEIRNAVSDTVTAESNEIGLKTCQKITEQMGGEFTYGREDNFFVTKISLPIVKK